MKTEHPMAEKEGKPQDFLRRAQVSGRKNDRLAREQLFCGT
jgi:hypothetical protein